jgi:hypothetical protein
MAEISEIMAAIDSFLSKKGKEDSYLVKKITGLFEGDDAPFNTEKGVLKEFKKKFKKLNDGAEKNTENFNELSKTIKKFNRVFTDNFFKNLRGFRDNLKISVLNNFFENLKDVNKKFKKGISPDKESVIQQESIVDVRIKEIDDGVANSLLSKISNIMARKINFSSDNKNEERYDKEQGFFSKILKGILGVSALFVGVGFISKFLNETEIGKSIKNKLGDFKDKALEALKPALKVLMNLFVEGMKQVLFELPKWFLKQTFNFFGLKEMLGEQYEGIAVILTKGIYYGVKTFFTKTLNKISFGLFGKLTQSLTGMFGSLGNSLIKIGKGLSDSLLRPLSVIGKIPGMLGKFFSNIGFGAGGGVAKVLTSITKISGGSLLKILGTGLKNIAKRIPFIGALISFKDAYDRFQKGDILGGFISIGSGIASTFPGIGTAISIGLDVLNAFLDYSDSGSKFKTMINDNFITRAIGDLINGTMDFFTNILEMLNPVSWGKSIWDWITGKKKSAEQQIKDSEQDSSVKPYSGARYDLPVKQVQDARVSGKNLIVPSNQDDVVLAKNNGPFDRAFKDMNHKLDVLTNVFSQGVELIASASVNGSSSIVQAVVSTAGSKQAPIISNSSDPIHSFRTRAQRAIESVR